MAVFNPEIPNVDPGNFLGYSQGIGRNQSPGTVLSGIAGMIETGAPAIDQAIQTNIYKDAASLVQPVRDVFGVEAATDIQEPVPRALAKSKADLARLAKGWQNGTVRDSHYYGQLNAVVKSLRVNYPGYERQIDNIIQEITGVTPANAIVEALQREALSDAEAGAKEAQNWYQYQKENQEWIKMVFPDWQGIGDTRYSQAQIYAAVADVTSKKASLEFEISQNNWKAQNNEFDHKDLVNTSRRIATDTGLQAMQAGLNSIDPSFKGLEKKFSDFRLGLGEEPTPEEIQQWQAGAVEHRRSLLDNIQMQLMNTPYDPNDSAKGSYWSNMNEQERKDVLDTAAGPFDRFVDSIVNKEYGLAHADALLVQGMTDRATAEWLRSNPAAARIASLPKVFGDQAMGVWLSSDAANMNLFNKIIGTDFIAKLAQGSVSDINQEFLRLKETDGTDSKLFKALTDTSTEFIVNPETNPILAEQAIQAMFANAGGLDLNLFREDQQATVYARLTNPNVTERIKELSKDNPVLWDNYSNWAYFSFRSVFRNLATEIKSVPPETLSLLNITYDPERGQIIATPKPGVAGKGLSAEGQTVALQYAQEQTLRQYAQLNMALKTLRPIVEENQGDFGKEVKGLLNILGVTTESPDSSDKSLEKRSETNNVLDDTSLFAEDDSNTAFLDLVASAGVEGTDLGRGYNETLGYGVFTGGPVDLVNMTLDEVDTLQGQMLEAPGNTFNSSAAGRYQIVRETLRGLRKELGLTGSEKFDEALQDKLARILLRRRGPDVRGLRQEWEGLKGVSDRKILEALLAG